MSQQAIVYRGAGAARSSLLLLPGDIANAVWYFKHRQLPKVTAIPYFSVFLVAIALFVGKGLGTVGLAYSGSGLYVVIYSSATLWSALFSFVLYKQRFSFWQIVAMLIVFCGLCVTTLKASSAPGKEGSAGGGGVAYGILVTVASACLQSLALVYFKQVTKGLHFSTSNFLLGSYGLLFDVMYIAAVTVPSWDELIAQPVAQKGNHITEIIVLYFGSTLINVAKSWGWGTTLQTGGPVVLGLLQACKSIAIFFLSAVLYCATQESQCYTLEKAVATVLVVGGVTMFSLAPKPADKVKQK